MRSFLISIAKSIWPLVPQRLRNQPFVLLLKSKFQRQNNEAVIPHSTVREVSTLDEVDEMLQMLDRAAAISDDELRRGFAKFQMKFPLELPYDPGSLEYHAAQMQLYEWLHGKPYTVNNEVSSFDTKAATSIPFPFYTESPQTEHWGKGDVM